MADDKNSGKVTVFPPVKRTAFSVMPSRANPAIPDEVWERLQQAGDIASQRLLQLLEDERFPFLSIKEQTRLIELALNRAYGAVDGSIRRAQQAAVDPEEGKGYNTLGALSRAAGRSLPEFKGRRLENVQTVNGSINHNALDAEPSENIPRDRY